MGTSAFELIQKLTSTRPAMRAVLDDARRIDRFYIPTRYPYGLPGGIPFESFSREDLEQAVAMAERIVLSAEAVVPSVS